MTENKSSKMGCLIPAIGAIIVLGVLALIPIASYISAYNKGNRMEKSIIAQYDQNQNTLSRMSLTVMDAAQVPDMAKEALKEVIKAAVEGRYGANGSQAMVQAMTEAYPGTLDMSLYTKLQNEIAGGRRDFANEQQLLIGKVQGYSTELGYFWSGLWLSIAGYPKIDLDKYKIIVSDYSNEAFKSGIDKGLQLNKK